mgnify:CR=1 FL=1
MYTREGGERLARNSLYDFVFLDLEVSYDVGAVAAIAEGLRIPSAVGRKTLLVRIPPIERDGEEVARARTREILELGADGVVLPHVRSPEEVRMVVSFFTDAGADVWSPSNPTGEILAMIMIEDPGALATIEEIALQAHLAHNIPEGMEPGLRATTFYDPANFTYPFGSHIAVVEVDLQTGKVDLISYTAVDDVGNVINPMIVDGQLHGGIAHGIGQCLLEEAVYDENGQLLSGELLDYAVPKAHQLVLFNLDRTVTPCPHNPLGVKGCGEAGAIAAPAAVANAVIDALKPFGIKHLDMPLTPEKVWNAIQAKGRS